MMPCLKHFLPYTTFIIYQSTFCCKEMRCIRNIMPKHRTWTCKKDRRVRMLHDLSSDSLYQAVE